MGCCELSYLLSVVNKDVLKLELSFKFNGVSGKLNKKLINGKLN